MDVQTRGIDIIRKALSSPVRQIAQNAGHDGAVVLGNLLRENDESKGFNASTDVYENLVEAGVTDPTKVVCNALQDEDRQTVGEGKSVSVRVALGGRLLNQKK